MPCSKAADMPSATSRIESVFSSARLARHEARLKADARSSEPRGRISDDNVVGSGSWLVERCIHHPDENGARRSHGIARELTGYWTAGLWGWAAELRGLGCGGCAGWAAGLRVSA